MEKNKKKKVSGSVVSNGVTNGHTKVVELTTQKVEEVVLPLADHIALSNEESNRVKLFEQNILQLKLQLADLEIQVLDAQNKKTSLVNSMREQNQNMVQEVRNIAQSYGIDVDGVKDSTHWNLDTASMTFSQVK